jgi:predicted outer membrane repeat protein
MFGLGWALLQSAAAATLLVSHDGASDFRTVQGAIDAASDGDIISVGAGEWNESLDFGGKSLTLRGASQSDTIIDGQGEFDQLIKADQGENLRIESLTLSNSYHRGIIVEGGSIEADDVLFWDLGSLEHFGGAIGAQNADISITNSRFFENFAYDGGAIHASGSMSIFIENTDFESNRGTGYTEEVREYEYDEDTGEEISSTVVVRQRQGRGGAIHVSGTGSLTITNATFIDNRSRWAGGALAVRTFDGLTTIDGALFEDNRSTRGAGGAIANWMHGEDVYELEEFAEIFGTLIVNNSEFIGNLSQRSSGGAIYTEGDFSAPMRLELSENQFLYNEASNEGGAIFVKRIYDEAVFDSSSFELNEGRNGGALYFNQQVLFTGTHLDLASNSAAQSGGGIYASDAVMVMLIDSQVRGNRAKSSQGGGVFATGLDETYPAKFVRVTVSDNSSRLEGGGVHYKNVANSTIEESLIEGNEAGSDSFGGGLFADDSAYVKIRNSVLRSNTAHYGGGAYINDNADGSDFFNNIFLDNDARTGAGFALCNSPYTLFYNNTVAGNRSMFESSGAAFYNSQVDFKNNIFAHNSGGSALHMYDLNSAFYAELAYNNFFQNEPSNLGGELDPSVLDLNGNLEVNPEFAHYNAGMPGDEASMVLAPSSPLIDAGDPFILDWDGTDSDVGAYGGDYLIVNDRDGDGHLSNVDCDDNDPTVYPGADEIWYDGRNSDCAFSSDYDADGDGVLHSSGGGTDCDDEDPTKSAPEDCPPEPEEETEGEDTDETIESESSPKGESTSGKLSCSSLPERAPSDHWMWLMIPIAAIWRSRRVHSDT